MMRWAVGGGFDAERLSGQHAGEAVFGFDHDAAGEEAPGEIAPGQTGRVEHGIGRPLFGGFPGPGRGAQAGQIPHGRDANHAAVAIGIADMEFIQRELEKCGAVSIGERLRWRPGGIFRHRRPFFQELGWHEGGLGKSGHRQGRSRRNGLFRFGFGQKINSPDAGA
jgi:hypothetical protein